MDMFFSFSIFATGDANSIVAFVRLPNSEIANFKMQGVNGLDGLYFDVTCRFILHWAFGDALSLWIGSVTSFLNIQPMELQSTALQGIVKSSNEDELFYLLPIQDLSALQELKGHLTTAIDVLSNPKEKSMEHKSMKF